MKIARFGLLAFFALLQFFAFSQKRATNIPPLAPPLIDANTPDWALEMYSAAPNVYKVDRLYAEFYKTHEFVKTTDTRNYKHWRRLIAKNDWVQEDGTLLFPTPEEAEAKRQAWIAEKAQLDQQAAQRGSSSPTSSWEQIGPFENAEPGSIYESRTSCQVAFDQSLSNPNVLYSVSQNGKVFKTTTHGDVWFPVGENYYFQGDTWSDISIAVDPTNENIVYYGTQSIYENPNLWKTTDGGTTWVNMNAPTAMTYNSMIINPTNTNIILVAGESGIYRSTNGGTSFSLVRAGYAWDLKFKTNDPNTVFAICQNGLKSDFYKSTDGGTTWNASITGWFSAAQSSDGGGRMTVSTTNPNLIYCIILGRVVGDNSDKPIVGIAKSIDAGANWTTPVNWNTNVSNGVTINSGQGFYDLDIEVSPLNDNLVYGGTQGDWKTTDGFATWGAGPTDIHADIQEIRFNGAGHFWICSDGGMDLVDNNVTVATPKSKGISGTEFWGFDQGWNEDSHVGSYYHNGESGYRPGYTDNRWRILGGGEPSTGYLSVGNAAKAWFSYPGGRILPGTLTGEVREFTYIKYPNESNGPANRSEIVPHPSCYNIHYLGKDNVLWKTTDGGSTFTALYTFGAAAADKVTSIEISRANPNVILVAQLKSGDDYLWKSTDGGVTFNLVTQPSSTGDGILLTTDPANADVFWVAYIKGGASANKVFKTTNGGVTWTNLTGLLSTNTHQPRAILHIGGTDGGVYVMTLHSMFYRNNTHTNWQAFGSGLPTRVENNYLRPFYKEGKLRMATVARGLWGIDFYENPNTFFAQATVDKLVANCARDTFYFDDYSMVNHTGATWSWAFPGASTVIGASTRNPKVIYGTPGTYTATMTLTTPGGTQSSSVTVTINPGCDADTIPGQVLRTAVNEDKFLAQGANLTNLTNFTVTGWWKPNGAQQAYAALFSSGDWCAHCDYTEGLIFDYYGSKLWYKWPGSAGVWGSNSGITIPLNEWSYVALVITPAGATMYLNDKKYVDNRPLSPGQIENINIGYGHYSKSFKGDIDEVTIWKRALSETEIRQLRHITKEDVIAGDPDLIGYWQFNELVNGQVQDNAGVNHGSLQNGAVLAASTAPVGGGTSQLMNLAAGTSVYNFANAGAKIYASDCVDMSGTLVATRLNIAPNLAPAANPTANNTWFLNYYGTSTAFTRFDSIQLTPTDGAFVTGLANAQDAVLHARPENSDAANWSPKAKALNINGNTIAWNRKNNITSSTQIGLTNGAPTFSETDPGAFFCQPEPLPGTKLVTTGVATSNAASPTAPQFGAAQDFSVSVWFKTTSTVTDGAIFSNKDWDSGSNPGWIFSITSGKVWWNVGGPAASGTGTARIDQKPTTPVINDGKWHIFTATCDRDGLSTIYLDGKSLGSTSMAAIGNINNSLKMSLGADDEDDYRVAVEVDEACVYNRVLTQNEVRELAHLTRTGAGTTTGLVSYFQFNNTGATEFDRAGNYNLTVGAAASRSASDAPIGPGASSRLSVAAAGVKNFATADAMLAFPATGTLPNGDIVVSKIDNSPNALPTCSAYASDATYWIIDNYGTNATFAALDSARFGGILVPSTNDIPATSYQLRQRVLPNEHLNNWVTKPGTSIGAQGGTGGWIKFGNASGITSGGQFLMTNALSAGIISGPAQVCSGGSATLDAGSGFTTYAWSNGGGSGQTATFSNISSPTTFLVTVTDANGCTGVAQKTVNVGGSASTTVSGANSVCSGGSATLDAGAGFTNYAWSNGGGASQSATFTNLTATTEFVVTITNSSGCTGTAAKTITVNANPSTTVSGANSVCPGASATLNAGAGFSSYAWSNGGGASQSATFTNLTATTTFVVTITNSSGCTGTAEKAVTVVPLSTSISGASEVCSGGSVTLDAGAGFTTYAWSNSGGTTQTATFTNVTLTRTYTVTVTANGCSATATKTVTVVAKPVATITTPALGGCIGGTSSVSVPAVSGGTYNWTVTGGTIVSGQGTNAVTASWTTSGGKSFAVTVTNSTGCSANSTKSMTVYAGPTLSAVTYAAGCGGASGEVNLTATAGLAPYNYAWTTGATSQDLVNVVAGTYTVTTTDARTCTKSATYTVAGGTTPPKPTGLTLAYTCGPLTANLTWKGPQGGSYELRYRPSTTTAWTDLGNIGNVFSYTVPGLLPNVNYYFSIRYVCPTTGFSAYVQKTGVSPNCALAAPNADRAETAEISGEGTFKILPNPATDRVKLVFENSENDSPAEISIFNAVGQAVLNRSVSALAGENVFEIEIGELPQGVYQVVLRAGEERFSESLVVLRR